ncbi:MAG: hypothetical protein ABJK39_12210 [Hyphomicrobiales bacterium]
MTNYLDLNTQPQTSPRGVTPKQTLPLAKHAGFTKAITANVVSLLSKVMRQSMQSWSDYMARHKSRQEVRNMLELDAAILDDMSLTKGDLNYVLKSRSQLLPTTRLKLISVQRRAVNRNDHLRRAEYLQSLVPSPFGGEAGPSAQPKAQGTTKQLH